MPKHAVTDRQQKTGNWDNPINWDYLGGKNINEVPEGDVAVFVTNLFTLTLTSSHTVDSVEIHGFLRMMEGAHLTTTDSFTLYNNFSIKPGASFLSTGNGEAKLLVGKSGEVFPFLFNEGTVEIRNHLVNHGVVENSGSFLVTGKVDNFGVIGNRGTLEFQNDFVDHENGSISNAPGGVVKFDKGFVARTEKVQTTGEIDIVGFAAGKAGEVDLSGNNSTLKLLGGGELDVQFGTAGGEQLFLDHSNNFSGQVRGFRTGDKIDVLDVDFNSAHFVESYSHNQLKLSDGTHTANIEIVGVSGHLTFSSDGSHGVLISVT